MNENKSSSLLARRSSVEQVETGLVLAPKFDSHGLLPVVSTDHNSGEVLMHAYMNETALLKTIETREAHYWSRSRRCVWHKGASSGFVQRLKEMIIDDDQDALWLRVEVVGGASCHVGYRSCFYRSVALGKPAAEHIALRQLEKEKVFDPKEVYKNAANPTRL